MAAAVKDAILFDGNREIALSPVAVALLGGQRTVDEIQALLDRVPPPDFVHA